MMETISRQRAHDLARAPLPITHLIPGKTWAGRLIKDLRGQEFNRSGGTDFAGWDETALYHYERDLEELG